MTKRFISRPDKQNRDFFEMTKEKELEFYKEGKQSNKN